MDLDNCAADEGTEGDTSDAGEAEKRHRKRASFVAFPDIADATADDVNGH